MGFIGLYSWYDERLNIQVVCVCVCVCVCVRERERERERERMDTICMYDENLNHIMRKINLSLPFQELGWDLEQEKRVGR